MDRYVREWGKERWKIRYSEPLITSFDETNLINGFDEGAMYFYYTVEFIYDDKIVFADRTHDEPKVQYLANLIDMVVSKEEKDMYVFEELEHHGFERKRLYCFHELMSDFTDEYFYRIEKNVIYVKQRGEKKQRIEMYNFIIGKNMVDGACGGNAFYWEELSRSEILEIKNLAIEFCKIAVEQYNNYLKTFRIKCPVCDEPQLMLNARVDKDRNGDTKFQCAKCGEKFDENDDYWLDEEEKEIY